MNADHAVMRRRVVGIDCANDAAAVERAVRDVAGVERVRVSSATQILTATLADAAALPLVERAVGGLGYRLEVLEASEALDGRDSDERVAGADSVPLDSQGAPPGYIRALWIVAGLNLGMGVVQVVAGFISRSQALKADALDFLADGAVTTVAALAVRWSLAARARIAAVQGLALFAMGVGVLANTASRILSSAPPEARVMGAFGAVALVVNVAAALVLLPYRTQQGSSATAVWRYSSSDALGNLATVAAAGLVAWLQSPWPDLVVAFVVAGLFLRAAWAIIRDARADLREE